MKQSISITIPKSTVKEMETFIDGIQIRNRSHLILIAITEWMEAKRNKGKGEQMTIKPITKRKRK